MSSASSSLLQGDWEIDSGREWKEDEQNSSESCWLCKLREETGAACLDAKACERRGCRRTRFAGFSPVHVSWWQRSAEGLRTTWPHRRHCWGCGRELGGSTVTRVCVCVRETEWCRYTTLVLRFVAHKFVHRANQFTTFTRVTPSWAAPKPRGPKTIAKAHPRRYTWNFAHQLQMFAIIMHTFCGFCSPVGLKQASQLCNNKSCASLCMKKQQRHWIIFWEPKWFASSVLTCQEFKIFSSFGLFFCVPIVYSDQSSRIFLVCGPQLKPRPRSTAI